MLLSLSNLARYRWSTAGIVCGALLFCQPSLAQTGVKDLFYRQLNSPNEQINTGFSYWIELKRDGKSQKVDSRVVFKSGDRIRFHLTADIDGYAHVVMLRGSTGSKFVLFPVAGKDASNSVRRGREYIIPNTYLVFDNAKGVENLRIVLSRTNVSSAAFLKPDAASQIAMATVSANSAIDPSTGNQQVLVAFNEQEQNNGKPAADQEQISAFADGDDSLSKDLYREDTRPARPHIPVAHRHPGPRKPGHKPPRLTALSNPPPLTLVVNTNPQEPLLAEIQLEHR